MFSNQGATVPLILPIMIGCVALVLALIVAIGFERLRWSLVRGYVRRREEHFSDLVLGVLIDPQSLLTYSSAHPGRRLGPRPFDTPILEEMLLSQANELRGSDRATMTELFESTGLVARALRRLRSRRWWRRLSAVQRLRVMRSVQAVPALMRAASDRNTHVRMAALLALAEINDERAYPLLLDALEDRATSVRMADILLMLGPSISAHLIERCTTTSDTHLVALYVRLLGLLQDPLASDVLMPFVDADVADLRRAAIVALGAIGDAQVVKVLRGRLTDCDAQVRMEVARALGNIGDQSGIGDLLQLLGDPARVVRYTAAHSLIRLGAAGLAALQQASQIGESGPRGIAAQVLAEQALGVM